MATTATSTSSKSETDSSGSGTDLSSSGSSSMRRPGTGGGSGQMTAHASLSTEHGQTRIADNVVAKIAGMSAREIPGIYSMGKGFARRMGQLRSLVPGQNDVSQSTQGVSVEVGEREAAIDLDVVTWYGQSIVEVTEAVRRNVIDRVEGMTGLKVVEVNINVDDIYVEGDDDDAPKESRVQ